MTNVHTYSVKDFRAALGEIVGRIRHTRETVIIERYGKPVARLMPFEDVVTDISLTEPRSTVMPSPVLEAPAAKPTRTKKVKP